MILTNKLGLPGAIVDAIRNDEYSPGEGVDYTVSQLAGKPPRAVELEKRFKDKISVDVSEMIFALDGKGIHKTLEQAKALAVKEKRLFLDVPYNHMVYRVSGQMDHLELRAGKGISTKLIDWKRTSRWSFQLGLKPEWENQLNLYDLLLHDNGYSDDSRELAICVIVSDWKRAESLRTKDYPPPVAMIDVPRWPRQKQFNFLQERLGAFVAARMELPECTPEERWARPDKFAVMKKGRKTALRVLEREEQARVWACDNGHATWEQVGERGSNIAIEWQPATGISIERRPGEAYIRCGYCFARQVCDQYKTANPEGE